MSLTPTSSVTSSVNVVDSSGPLGRDHSIALRQQSGTQKTKTWLITKLAIFPLWSLLLGVLLGVCIADQCGSSPWPVVSLTCLLLGIVSYRIKATWIFLFTLGTLLGFISHGSQIDRQAAWISYVDNHPSPPSCHITATVIHTGSNQRGPYLVETSRISSNGDVQVPRNRQVRLLLDLRTSFANKNRCLQYGDIITFHGRLKPIPTARNPHAFDRVKWMHRQGTNLMIIPREGLQPHDISPAYKPIRTLARWRTHLRNLMTLGISPDSQQAQLIRAVVLGERPPQPATMIDDFRESGTLHVFAVSGLHVGMFGAIIGSLLWFFRAPRWLLISGIIIGMSLYAGVTGLRPPSVRAVIMASVFLSGFLILRRPSLINSLAASAIAVLLWNGHQLFTPGFQLSYVVLLSIAFTSTLWQQLFKPMTELDPFMPRLLLTSWQERKLRLKNSLKNALTISAAAWTGSGPLMWIHFGIVTPIAIIAGLPLMLMVFLILALAMAGITAATIWTPAGQWINRTNAIVASTTIHTAKFFANIPGGHWHQQIRRSQHGQIIVFDLPQGGGACYIDIGGGMMLDCGRGDHFYRHILPALTAMQVSPDSLIISHADSTHSGGMAPCLQHFAPKQALIPRLDLRSPSYQTFLNSARQADCRLVIPRSGQRFPIDTDSFIEILHAPAELPGDGRADDSGLVLRLHWYGFRILFTGDAGFITETRLLASGVDLTADVIVTGRNSGDFTGKEDFYQRVSPHAIITTNNFYPDYEKVPPHWFQMTRQLGIATFDQGKCGAVMISIQDGILTLTPTLGTQASYSIRH